MKNDQFGSIWRKWDLHCHTPESHPNAFGADFDAYFKALVARIAETETAAIGITDYFTIEGYKKLRAIIDDPGRLNTLLSPEHVQTALNTLFLPNIEFRLDIIVENRRVNFHVVFSDKVSIRDIEENFLHELDFIYEGRPWEKDSMLKLKIGNLEDLGNTLKKTHEAFRGKSDLEVGMMNAVVSHTQISKLLEDRRPIFFGQYVIAVPADEDLSSLSWDGQAHQTRKVIIQKSHVLFTGNEKTRKWAVGGYHPSPDAFVAEFKCLKTCCTTSDAHDVPSLLKYPNGKVCWFKADPTFMGLRQVLIEPESRVYIGDKPPIFQRVEDNPTKYISSISIRKTEGANITEPWFDCHIPLNYELVAIIGNKGSGKSALAESIGFLGNSPHMDHFSFLHPTKFLRTKEHKARNFDASLEWRDGRMEKRNLETQLPSDAVETVKYIPQSYLEVICNELAGSSKSDFDQELKEVVFSHVGIENTFGLSSLDEIIQYRTKETMMAIEELKLELHSVNESIVALETKLSDSYKSSLVNKLAQKNTELDGHEAAKPKTVEEPTTVPDSQSGASGIASAIATKRSELKAAKKSVMELSEARQITVKRIADLTNLLEKLAALERQYDTFCAGAKDLILSLGLTVDDLVSFEVKKGQVDILLQQANASKDELDQKLDSQRAGSPAASVADIRQVIDSLQEKLDAPSREYQAYLTAMVVWQEGKNSLIGEADRPGTLRNLEAQIADIANAPLRLQEARAMRTTLARSIHAKKRGLVETLKSLYQPVQQAVTIQPLKESGIELSFSVNIVPVEFEEAFFGRINQGRVGSFYGAGPGAKLLRDVVARASFNEEDGCAAFIGEIEERLSRDTRGENQAKVELFSQLKRDVTTLQFYDWLYSMDYLEPRYGLEWGEKPISQLSPGERGTLLLVFFLIVDNRDIPLVIDQPEENLDNQTVYRILVPAIKFAKNRRQIIMVTHNPNLAVVCDANQVIYAHFDKKTVTITYEQGAIENASINRHVVDILEGTRPAFETRDEKYEAVEGPSGR